MTEVTLPIEGRDRSRMVDSVKKCVSRIIFPGLLTLVAIACQASDPRIDSWFTTYSGKYARIYATDADKTSGNAVSTWSRGTINQSIPARCGVYFVGNSTSWVYIRS